MQISSILDFLWMRRSGEWWLVSRCSHFPIFSPVLSFFFVRFYSLSFIVPGDRFGCFYIRSDSMIRRLRVKPIFSNVDTEWRFDESRCDFSSYVLRFRYGNRKYIYIYIYIKSEREKRERETERKRTKYDEGRTVKKQHNDIQNKGAFALSRMYPSYSECWRRESRNVSEQGNVSKAGAIFVGKIRQPRPRK